MSTDPYELLGVPKNATREQIRRARRRAAAKLHPDKGGDTARMAAINAAHALLTDDSRRASFDKDGTIEPPGRSAAQKGNALVCQLAVEMLNKLPDGEDLVEHVRRALQMQLLQLRSAADQCCQKRGRMERRIKRIRSRGAENLFADMMHELCAEAERFVRKVELDIEVRQAALEVLEHYSCEPEHAGGYMVIFS